MKKYFFLVALAFLLTGFINNQNGDQKNKISNNSAPQIYQEIETTLTDQSIDHLNPSTAVDKEIKRLQENGVIFWYDQNRKISSRTPMHYLQNRLECKKGPEEKCLITGLEVYPDSIPPGYKVDKCVAEGGTCLLVEPAFQKNLANNMEGIVEFYGFGKDIYMIGNLKRDDNYSIFKNEEEIFYHKMTSVTEGVVEEAEVVLNSPTFTFLDPKESKDENNPVIVRNIWYKGETLNEKYGVEESSYLFSFKNKIGFVGKKNEKKFFFFNSQKISQDFDAIRTHGCCEIFPYPIEIDENGILFFLAKRGEKYFFVEINLNEYLK